MNAYGRAPSGPVRKMTFSRFTSQWQMMSAGPSTNRVSSPSHCAPGGGLKPITAW